VPGKCESGIHHGGHGDTEALSKHDVADKLPCFVANRHPEEGLPTKDLAENFGARLHGKILRRQASSG